MKELFTKEFSLTGISTSIFGLSWEYCKSEKEYINSIFNFLYGRRVLFSPYAIEQPMHFIPSIIAIKNYITDVLCQVDFCKENKEYLFKMIDICNDTLDNTNNIINNNYKPASCLAEEFIGYSFCEMRSLLEPFRQEFYTVIEQLEKKNKLVFPNKKGDLFNVKFNEPLESIIDDIFDNIYSPEVRQYLLELINRKQLINFFEIYKPFLFATLFVQFDFDFQLSLIKHINDNYDKSTKNKMMKKYDIFAFIASQIYKNEAVDPQIKIIAIEIVHKSATTIPSSIELLKTDPLQRFTNKN